MNKKSVAHLEQRFFDENEKNKNKKCKNTY